MIPFVNYVRNLPADFVSYLGHTSCAVFIRKNKNKKGAAIKEEPNVETKLSAFEQAKFDEDLMLKRE